MITQRALDTIGDLLQREEERIREEYTKEGYPEWASQEVINELWEAHELLYDNTERS